MLRLSLISLVSVVALAACATATDQPSGGSTAEKVATAGSASTAIEAPDYKQGDTCTFQISQNGRKVVATETITQVADGRVTVALVGDDGSQREILVDRDRVAKSVSLVDGQQLRFEPPSKWIDLPLQPGSAWTDSKVVIGETFRADNKAHVQATGWETVRVPAGEFRALKVVFKETFQGQTTKGEKFNGSGQFTYWIAPGVKCLLKQEYRNSFGESGSSQLVAYRSA